MNDDSPQWRYEDVPPREWSWSVARDPNLECEADRYVKLTPDGIEYTGDCWHPNWGGAYSIGFQSYEEFLARGDLVGDMPAEHAAAIRAHVEAHRRPGAPAVLVLLAERAPEDPRRFQRISCGIDEYSLKALWVSEEAGETHTVHEVFRGPIAAGAHTVAAAFYLRPDRKQVALLSGCRVRVVHGETRVVRMALQPGSRQIVARVE